MTNQLSQSITKNDIKILVAIASVILAIAFAWSDLKNDANNAVKESISAKQLAENITEKQDTMALDIREIKTILKQQGLTSKKPSDMVFASIISSPSSTLAPTPPSVVVNNYIQPTPTPEPILSPTLEPTQKSKKKVIKNEPTPIICIGNMCI